MMKNQLNIATIIIPVLGTRVFFTKSQSNVAYTVIDEGSCRNTFGLR